MSFRLCSISLLILCSWVHLSAEATAEDGGQIAQNKPNIIVILSGDQGLGDAGFQGHPVLKTPVLDEMASSGAILNRFYAVGADAQSKASLLTG